MTKEYFVELLRKRGYGSAILINGKVEVAVVGTKEDFRKAYLDISLFAKKIGYTHSFGVRMLEEEDEVRGVVN